MNYAKYLIIIILLILIYFYNFYTPEVITFTSNKKGVNIFILGSVHGNEPAGTESCYKLIEMLESKKLNLKSGSITILPMPNPLGFFIGSRHQLKPFNSDINRNFLGNGLDRISNIILSYVKKSDFIIDVHEGWGFNRINPNSIGSTLAYTQFDRAKNVCKEMLKEVNKTIKNNNYKFNILKKKKNKCTPKGSLGCYCQKNNIDYILIETTGQNDKQKLEIRVGQDIIFLKTGLKELKII